MTTREGSAEPESAGLTPVAVQTWLARIGADDLLGANPTRYIRRSGAEGIANYITTDDPGGFDEIAFWRPLPGMLVYALIRTPSTMARTPEVIAEYPSPYVVVGTQSMPGGGTFTQAGSSHPYRAPAHIVIFDNNEPYQQTSEEVADLAGVWIPVESLGSDFVGVPIAPVVTGTPLACAAAAFIRNFAVDVAARGADVDPDTELAVIDLVRAILARRQADQSPDRVCTDPVYVREATRALIDHHFRDPEFSAETIAETLHMSRRHLYRYFGDTDDSPATMIATRRLERARELLAYREGAGLDSIAAASGFTSAATAIDSVRHSPSLRTNTVARSPTADVRALMAWGVVTRGRVRDGRPYRTRSAAGGALATRGRSRSRRRGRCGAPAWAGGRVDSRVRASRRRRSRRVPCVTCMRTVRSSRRVCSNRMDDTEITDARSTPNPVLPFWSPVSPGRSPSVAARNRPRTVPDNSSCTPLWSRR
ncbi:AraC family transcriptional regulator [Gordonia polyisoprenivorans]|uniref:AraC family transcriptional regulator n=1 Tax=Gordonia polyisoprenivorans TaxID=84595 RepID=UPI002300EE46|nr:helix-turn-helix domain-containing protein [Gordonia polyisoprenivorans]WCB38147.1 helix-turn-helix domain-containing protein [Gordonia polyisoprenivorans]